MELKMAARVWRIGKLVWRKLPQPDDTVHFAVRLASGKAFSFSNLLCFARSAVIIHPNAIS